MNEAEQTVLAHYSCTRCKLQGVDIHAPARINGMGIMDWMVKVVYPVAMEDHLKRSPQCEERFLDIGLRPPDYQPEIVQ